MESENQKELHAAFAAASAKSLDIIQDYIADGYKDTLARLLVYIGKERAETMLSSMPPELKADVQTRYDALCGKKNSDPDIMSTAGKVLKRSGFYGKPAVENILDYMHGKDPDLYKNECDALFTLNPVLALNVERYSMTMDCLLLLDDRGVQKWLREVSTEDLAMALKGVPRAIQDKIFRNMSKRACTMLQEEMEFMGVVRVQDVYERQQKILDQLNQLCTDGEVLYPGTAEKGLVI